MERKTETTILQPQKVLELKKHVAIIHSNNKLTLLQRKIANALLFNAYKDLQTKDEHSIHIARLCELIGYASHDHKTIKRALVNLLSTVLEWNLVDGERLDTEGIWNASSIIADASIHGALCTYSYSNKMRQLLYKPHMYGRLDMHVQAKFQSGYGLALYENCNRFQEIGQTPWFRLDKFRKLMGVEENKYKVFRDFKTRVLDKAVQEVNKYSSLIISPQIRKQNRKVDYIQFLIKKENVTAISLNSKTILEDELYELLTSQFRLTSKQLSSVLGQYDKQYISEKINIIQASPNYQKGKVKNLSHYLFSALRDDYQPAKESKTIKSKEIKNKETKVIHLNKNVDKTRENIAIQIEFKRFQDKQLFGLFTQLTETQRSDLLKQFDKFLVGMYHHVYLRSGLQNLLVQEQLCLFLHQIKHELIKQLITFDEWLKEKEKKQKKEMRQENKMKEETELKLENKMKQEKEMKQKEEMRQENKMIQEKEPKQKRETKREKEKLKSC